VKSPCRMLSLVSPGFPEEARDDVAVMNSSRSDPIWFMSKPDMNRDSSDSSLILQVLSNPRSCACWLLQANEEASLPKSGMLVICELAGLDSNVHVS
jgi:hypothetical protein